MKTEKEIRGRIAELERNVGSVPEVYRVIAVLRWVLGDVDEEK